MNLRDQWHGNLLNAEMLFPLCWHTKWHVLYIVQFISAIEKK